MSTGTTCPGIGMLAALRALIARSQIFVPQPLRACVVQSHPLPAEFEDVDIAILEWIAAEGRRLRRPIARL